MSSQGRAMAGSRGVCGMSVMWRDGRICEGRPGASPGSSGWGAFTTVGCDHGRPLLWSQHGRRLAASLEVLGADTDVRIPTAHDLCQLLEASGLYGAARLRVVAQRIEPSVWRAEASASPCEPGPALPPAELTIERWPSAPPLAGHKTLARLAWDLARERAQRDGFDDAMLVDEKNNLLETSVANVFVVRDGVARTPSAPSRCLPGVMRGWLLDRLGRAGLAVEICELGFDDLATADEIWLSNAVIGLRRVASVDQQRWREWPCFESLADLGIPAPGWGAGGR
jgi:branched-subunit amino acid aminotransferase/4-amino-4-deoxychorismate lyase